MGKYQLKLPKMGESIAEATITKWLKDVGDNVKKFTAICAECKNKPAIFTHRLVNNKSQELIGNDIYKPMCRKCYNKNNI